MQQEYEWPKHSINHVLQNPTWPTEWKQFTILLAHEHYMMTGDNSITENNFELLKNNTMLPFIVSTGINVVLFYYIFQWSSLTCNCLCLYIRTQAQI